MIEGNRFFIEPIKKKEEPVPLLKDEPNLDRTLSLIDSFLTSMHTISSQSIKEMVCMEWINAVSSPQTNAPAP